MGKFFGGVMDLRKQQMRVFKAGADRANRSEADDDEIIDGLRNPLLAERFGAAYEQAAGEVELVRDAAPAFDEAAFLAGHGRRFGRWVKRPATCAGGGLCLQRRAAKVRAELRGRLEQGDEPGSLRPGVIAAQRAQGP